MSKFQQNFDIHVREQNGDSRFRLLWIDTDGSSCEEHTNSRQNLLKTNTDTRGLAEKNPISTGPGQSKTPEELTTEYLTELYKHIMYTLEQKLGKAILRTVPLEFCLTVPAIWSEVAKEKTLNACKLAGIKSASDIFIVSEPVSRKPLILEAMR